MQRLGGFDQRAAGRDHVVDDDRDLALDVADDVGHLGDVGLGPALDDHRQRRFQPLGEELGPRHAAGVGRDDDDLLAEELLVAQVVAHVRRGHQVVDRNVEEALNLRGVQVERHDALGAGRLQHVGQQLGRDRLAAFGLLVLLGVAVVRDRPR